MRINNINIIGFGKMKDVKIDFDKNLNIIYGKNEAGKSTTHSYIRAMLFGINSKKSRSRLNNYMKFEPWEDKDVYEGYLEFTYNNKTYIIHRDFRDDDNNFTIEDKTTGSTINEPELFMKEVLYQLNETSFNNTISISQLKSATESGMITELRKYIANLNTSGDMSINTLAAIEYLKNQKNNYNEKLIKDATIKYTKNLGETRKIEKELNSDEYKNRIPEIQKQKEDSNAKVKSNIEKIDKLEKNIEFDTITLKKHGFDNKNDIDQLKLETERIYMEYELLRNAGRKVGRIITDLLVMAIGIILGVASTLILAVSYPNIASLVGLDSLAKKTGTIASIINSIPIPLAPLIGFFYALALISFISGFVFLISDSQTKNKIEDMEGVLSEVLNHQINTPVVSESNMKSFKNHIREMYTTMSKIDANKDTIKELEKENEAIISNNDSFIREIEKQQRLQYEIEEKVREQNKLRTEGDKLKKDIAYNDDIQKEIESIDMALEMINDLSSKVKIMFGTHLNARASEYLSHITGGVYNNLSVDDSLSITLNENNRVIPLEQVSGGAKDQIYLSLRLAAADLIEGNHEKLPLLFDDCFALYDNERLEKALSWLAKSIDRQIIVFTCHTREEEALVKNNISHKFIEI